MLQLAEGQEFFYYLTNNEVSSNQQINSLRLKFALRHTQYSIRHMELLDDVRVERMKVACATNFVFILWLLLTTPYWTNSHGVTSHNPWACLAQICFTTKDAHKNVTSNRIVGYFANTSKHYVCINNKLFLAPPLQSPLIYKWKGDWSRSKRNILKTHNNSMFYFCRMAYSRSLEKSLDGVKDMEVTQTKKQTSTNACLTIVDKTKNRSSAQGKTFPL